MKRSPLPSARVSVGNGGDCRINVSDKIFRCRFYRSSSMLPKSAESRRLNKESGGSLISRFPSDVRWTTAMESTGLRRSTDGEIVRKKKRQREKKREKKKKRDRGIERERERSEKDFRWESPNDFHSDAQALKRRVLDLRFKIVPRIYEYCETVYVTGRVLLGFFGRFCFVLFLVTLSLNIPQKHRKTRTKHKTKFNVHRAI